MHVSPAKHSYAWLPRKCDYWTDRHTDRKTDGGTDRQTPDKVIPMCRNASQATHKDCQIPSLILITSNITFGPKVWLEWLLLLEVFEDFDHTGRFSDGIHRRVVTPDKLLCRPKTFVPERHSRVYNVLPITAHNYEPVKVECGTYLKFGDMNLERCYAITLKHLLFVWPYFCRATTLYLFTRLYFSRLSDFLHLKLLMNFIFAPYMLSQI